MSPPEFLRKEKSDYVRVVKSPTNLDVQIVEVEEDKLDDMYCPEWVRHAIMFLPITAAAAVLSGYAYWKLQFGQLLMLRGLGMDMDTRIFFSVIDLILSSKNSWSNLGCNFGTRAIVLTLVFGSTDKLQSYPGRSCDFNAL